MCLKRGSRFWITLAVSVIVGLMVACSCMPPAPAAQPSKPTVTIIAPVNDSQMVVGQPTTIQVSAVDAQGVTRIEIKVDGALVATPQSPSAQGQTTLTAAQDWTFAQAGSHAITAQAFNAAGQASDVVAVTVQAVESVAVQPSPTATPTGPAPTSTVPPPTVEPTKPPPTAVPPTKPPPTAVPPTTPPAPTIKSFTANPGTITAGESSTLQWEVTGANSVTIDHGVGQVGLSGSKQVSPAGTTTYKLTAQGAGGIVTKQVQVQVNPVPVGDWPLVRYGNRGAVVFAIQYLLRAEGYALSADGIFGPQTQAAVKSFQGAKGLAVDGIVGPNTWTALVQGHTVKMNNTGDAVRAVQHLLQYVYGYNDVAVDGIFGPKTRAAVRAFQTSRGLTVDGIVGPKTWKALAAGT